MSPTGDTVRRDREAADQLMRENRITEAHRAYQVLWARSRGVFEPVERMWLLLAIGYAAVRARDYDDALEACQSALDRFKDTKQVVGNPLFHLIVGLAQHGKGEPVEVTDDNFARALICGGPEMFVDEDPRHLARMKQILKPPAELGTWDGYTGCSRDLLDGAPGYLAEVLAHRLGSPPPYRYGD